MPRRYTVIIVRTGCLPVPKMTYFDNCRNIALMSTCTTPPAYAAWRRGKGRSPCWNSDQCFRLYLAAAHALGARKSSLGKFATAVGTYECSSIHGIILQSPTVLHVQISTISLFIQHNLQSS